jgi:hypothetical protein
MPNQKRNGNAFEFSLVDEASHIFTAAGINIYIKTDAVYANAASAFNSLNTSNQVRFRKAAAAAIHHLLNLEPRLTNPTSPSDVLTISLQPDSAGQQGDVRDILFKRAVQNWEIGISAKNNHMAMKHSRLSDLIDFGKEWVSIPCSPAYFTSVVPLFQQLRTLKGTPWKSVSQKESTYYVPVLNAFAAELIALNAANTGVAGRLASYLIGRNDFYKIIRRKDTVEIYGFNINGELNKAAGTIKPVIKVTRLKLPEQIIQIQLKPGSSTTSHLVCDEGWQTSFRIHSADSNVVPSLKFDVKLIGHPQSMYAHHMAY